GPPLNSSGVSPVATTVPVTAKRLRTVIEQRDRDSKKHTLLYPCNVANCKRLKCFQKSSKESRIDSCKIFWSKCYDVRKIWLQQQAGFEKLFAASLAGRCSTQIQKPLS